MVEGNPVMNTLAKRLKRVMRKHGSDDAVDDDEQREESDDLDESTAALLSMLPDASIVVDKHNEVVRSSPQTYMLGVVANDEIVQPAILDAVERIRLTGGKTKFDLQTQTPKEFLRDHDEFDVINAQVSSEQHATLKATQMPGDNDDASAISRPNWLKITVGRINQDFVVVLLADVSEAIRFSQTRDAFIENVSEQLQKPTMALSQLALDLEHAPSANAEVHRDAALVHKHSAHLDHMLADLMLLMKAQEPIVPNAENQINLLQLAQELVERLRAQAQMKEISLHVGGDAAAVINGDREQIKAALIKLIENAIGYSQPHSSVNIAVSHSRDNTHAIVRVLDQGIGIAKNEQRQVFERFYRGSHQTDDTQEGIGLGLAIVKHVALTHHGSATVWSSEGRGSTFSMIFPSAATPTQIHTNPHSVHSVVDNTASHTTDTAISTTAGAVTKAAN